MMDRLDATIDLAIVRDDLSAARFDRYERAAGYDLGSAMDLYLWNTDVSSALFAVLQTVEVILRNAMSKQIETMHRASGFDGMWFDDPFNLLDDRHHQDIDHGRFLLQRDRHPITQDRMITVLSFGFWRYLLAARYEHTLWTPALRKAFPHARNGGRLYIAKRVERLNYLRNRIAHHEPVFRRNLGRDMDEALDVVAAISPASAAWLELYSWLPGLLINGVPMQRRAGA